MIAQLDPDVIKMRPLLVPRRLVSYGLFEGRPLTTKGQWINPLLFAQFGLVRHLPAIRKVKKPIYILGTGRSGTTILGVLFHMHPGAGFLNEPKALWHAIYPDEDVIGSYSRGQAYYRLEAEAATLPVRRAAHRLFGYYLALSGASRVVDKYPEMIFRVPFLTSIFPDARLVFLVRDGLDTLRSIASWSGSHQVSQNAETHDWWGVNNRKWHLLLEQVVARDALLKDVLPEIAQFTRQEDMAAVEWIVTMREGKKWLEARPDQMHLVRYEELVREPQKTLQALLAFCELPDDPVMFEYARRNLSLPPAKRPVHLHPAIQQPFDQTMQQMGYSGSWENE